MDGVVGSGVVMSGNRVGFIVGPKTEMNIERM